MPKWEVCRIDWRRSWTGVGPFRKEHTQFIAIADTANGEKIIAVSDATNTFEDRARLVSKLLADGWEPISAGDSGLVTTFRRQVS